ncbi:MAG: hypothetical protein CMK09_15140 [Ponticaulis sp.]|nr:hypothetical protein [Ponticaulis sp.]|tara:strand:- start:27905 stop:29032 length:1128 start_codon:yes stop_codon:yes gene_type:complete
MTDMVVTSEKPDQPIAWELAHQWSRAWRVIKWLFTALVVLAFLLVIGQMYLFYDLFFRIHPILGISFAAILTGLLIWLIGRPMISFWRTPIAAKPPPPPQDPSLPTRAEAITRLRYDLKYLKALAKNPAMSGDANAIRADIASGELLLEDLRSRGADEHKTLLQALRTYEHTHIETRLKEIDARVDKLIHSEAVGVGLATTVSMNGTIDAFIVLWRNANLVAKIARLYFGRPNFRGSLLVIRDVAAMVVLSRALEDVTDLTGEILGSVLGRMGGIVAGPLMDGGINAMMTLKLGYLAKRRCRSFESWSLKQAGAISKEAMEGVKKESGSVITDLISASGGITKIASRAGEKAWQGSKNAWSQVQGWFGPKTEKQG